MDLLRKIWPTPFKIEKGNIVSFLIQLIIFLIVCAVVGWLMAILSVIPIVGIIFGIIGSLIPLGLVYYIYNKAIEIILGRFSILSNLLQFLPVQDIFVNLVPIISALGVGIGMLGSMMTIRKHLRV